MANGGTLNPERKFPRFTKTRHLLPQDEWQRRSGSGVRAPYKLPNSLAFWRLPHQSRQITCPADSANANIFELRVYPEKSG